MHKEYAQNVYREAEMPEYFDDVLSNVIARIDHGDVCDLGSHAIGHYWAMGYIERVNSYSCYDLSVEALNIFQDKIANWQDGEIEEYSHYLRILREKGLLTLSNAELEMQLREKLDTVKVFDFLKDTPDKEYDCVLSNEALAVVDSVEDLKKAIKTAFDFTKKGGMLLNVSGPFVNEDDYVKNMQNFQIEGRLAPTGEMFVEVMKDVGFTDVKLITLPVKNYDNYKRLDICSAVKPS